MNVVAELLEKVRTLESTYLTEEDCQQFLRDVEKLLVSPPVRMIGPGCAFRWLVGSKMVEIWVRKRGVGCAIQIDARVFAYLEAARHENAMLDRASQYGGAPYWWRKDITELELSIPSEWQWAPPNYVVNDWCEFEISVGATLQELPTNIAVTPPEWLKPLKLLGSSVPRDVVFQYVWNMPEDSLWRRVVFSASARGITVTGCGVTGEVLYLDIPRRYLENKEVDITRVVAGIAGGQAAVDELQFFRAYGFDGLYPITPRHVSGKARAIPSKVTSVRELAAFLAEREANPDLMPVRKKPATQKELNFSVAPKRIVQVRAGT